MYLFRDIMSVELTNIVTLFQDILEREIDRNEILKDSPYEEFAYSDEEVMEEAKRAFNDAYKNQITKIIKENVKGTAMKAGKTNGSNTR